MPEQVVDEVEVPVESGGTEVVVTPPTETTVPGEQGTVTEPSITNPPQEAAPDATTTVAPQASVTAP